MKRGNFTRFCTYCGVLGLILTLRTWIFACFVFAVYFFQQDARNTGDKVTFIPWT